MMYENRHERKSYQNPLGGIAVGIFVIALAVAIFLGIGWNVFLPILFVGLAFASLFGSFSSYNHKAAYGGIQGFTWLLGLALCFAIGFWPWILLPLGVSIILGTLAAPIAAGLNREFTPTYPPYQAPYQPGQPYQPGEPYQPYQQGYQTAQQEPETPQENEQQREYTQQPK
ncbi:MAG TPA: hypothetical protein VJ761_21105 [Ktedonobacteraceae bacterium]|nr:hypothetical protein [Ktedonobacteraceae bacterium]